MSDRLRFVIWLCFLDLVFGIVMLIAGFVSGYSCRMLIESASIKNSGK